MGKISDTKTRYALTIDKKTKKQLEDIAKHDKRSLNNLVCLILEEYLQNEGKK